MRHDRAAPRSRRPIAGYAGGEEIWRRFGECIIADYFRPPGTPTQPVGVGYLANAWMRVRHPDYDELRRILDTIGQTIRVRAH